MAQPRCSETAAPFGQLPDGRRAALYTLESRLLRARVSDYGGRVVSLECVARDGRFEEILLGFETAAAYATAPGAFGALLGRTANRIGGGRFAFDGRVYELSKNENGSTLHGGDIGFDKVLWRVGENSPTRLELHHVSADGDQGFPGEAAVKATFRVEDDTLWLEFLASTTKATPLSLSAHPYFNLAGPTADDILAHEVTIPADCFLPLDDRQIPTGELRPVAGTPFDFRSATAIGARIRSPDRQLLVARGYDHYFVCNPDGALRLVARVREPRSGRTLELLTTQPGLQFYTGNNLNGSVAGRGGAYRQSAGFALEPQGFPDAPNRPQFPTTILRPGVQYR